MAKLFNLTSTLSQFFRLNKNFFAIFSITQTDMNIFILEKLYLILEYSIIQRMSANLHVLPVKFKKQIKNLKRTLYVSASIVRLFSALSLFYPKERNCYVEHWAKINHLQNLITRAIIYTAYCHYKFPSMLLEVSLLQCKCVSTLCMIPLQYFSLV